jgi:hypothetical protein
MAIVNNTPQNTRELKDALLSKAATLATGVTTGIDLVQSTPYPTTEQVVLNVYNGALAGTNTTAAFWVQDSADNSTFTSLSTLGSVTKTVPTNAAASKVASFSLPPGTRQYVRVSSSLSGATTGDFTASIMF